MAELGGGDGQVCWVSDDLIAIGIGDYTGVSATLQGSGWVSTGQLVAFVSRLKLPSMYKREEPC